MNLMMVSWLVCQLYLKAIIIKYLTRTMGCIG